MNTNNTIDQLVLELSNSLISSYQLPEGTIRDAVKLALYNAYYRGVHDGVERMSEAVRKDNEAADFRAKHLGHPE